MKKLAKWPGWDGDQPLNASSACPICGKDTPHGHYDDEAEIELVARPTFEFQLRHWLGTYLPQQRARRGIVMGVQSWSRSWTPQRSNNRPPDYADPVVETLWGFWLGAWSAKPSWCNASDNLANQKQVERQSPSQQYGV